MALAAAEEVAAGDEAQELIERMNELETALNDLLNVVTEYKQPGWLRRVLKLKKHKR